MHGSFNAKHLAKSLGMRYEKHLANSVFNAKKPLDYATQNFLATTSVQFKKKFCHAQKYTTQIPLLLEFATFNTTGLPSAHHNFATFAPKATPL